MLNPDGASRWTRENAIGIDLNRDALRLIAPRITDIKAGERQSECRLWF